MPRVRKHTLNPEDYTCATFRLTGGELQLVGEIARLRGISKSAWLHRVVSDAAEDEIEQLGLSNFIPSTLHPEVDSIQPEETQDVEA